MEAFADRLFDAVRQRGNACVVGLDPVVDYLPSEFLRTSGAGDQDELTVEEAAALIERYCLMVLDVVGDLVPAVKPQMAYFERYGSYGMRALERCMQSARERGLVVLLDGKRGDIGSTSTAYAEAYLARSPSRPWEADCLTLNPYLGRDSIEPFVKVAGEAGKGLFVCVRTSNPGAAVVQDLVADGARVHEHVADLVAELGKDLVGECGYSSVGAVVGATQPEAAARLRARLPKVPFLVPGVGAQGGSLDAVRACFDSQGLGAVVNSSRGVLYPHRFGSDQSRAASSSPEDAVRGAAEAFVAQVRGAVGPAGAHP